MRRVQVQLGHATLLIEESTGAPDFFITANIAGMSMGFPGVKTSDLVDLVVELTQFPELRACLEAVRNALDVDKGRTR